MAEINKRNVWIVQNDTRKDFTEAEKFGKLRSLFPGNPGRYEGDKFIAYLRGKLEADYVPGDYILPVGDPTLVGLVTGVVLELDGEVNFLRWDREKYTYRTFTVNFYGSSGAVEISIYDEEDDDLKFNR